ncbi:MAG: DUF4190 domain-containing protein [Mycobacteriales bacterium]
MSNTPLDPRDRGSQRDDVPGYRDDMRRDNPYAAPVDQGAYGTERVVTGQPYPVAARNGVGTAALVLGILGVLSAVFLVGGFLGLLALILGAVGLGRVNRREANNRGSAMAGVVLGLIAIAISVGVGAFAYSNRDKISNLSDCLADATTTAARQSCETRFEKELTR